MRPPRPNDSPEWGSPYSRSSGRRPRRGSSARDRSLGRPNPNPYHFNRNRSTDAFSTDSDFSDINISISRRSSSASRPMRSRSPIGPSLVSSLPRATDVETDVSLDDTNQVELVIYPSYLSQEEYEEIHETCQVIKQKLMSRTAISSVGILYQNADSSIKDILDNLYAKQTLYAIVVSCDIMASRTRTVTLYKLRCTNAPERVDMHEVIDRIESDFRMHYGNRGSSFIRSFDRVGAEDRQPLFTRHYRGNDYLTHQDNQNPGPSLTQGASTRQVVPENDDQPLEPFATRRASAPVDSNNNGQNNSSTNRAFSQIGLPGVPASQFSQNTAASFASVSQAPPMGPASLPPRFPAPPQPARFVSHFNTSSLSTHPGTFGSAFMNSTSTPNASNNPSFTNASLNVSTTSSEASHSSSQPEKGISDQFPSDVRSTLMKMVKENSCVGITLPELENTIDFLLMQKLKTRKAISALTQNNQPSTSSEQFMAANDVNMRDQTPNSRNIVNSTELIGQPASFSQPVTIGQPKQKMEQSSSVKPDVKKAAEFFKAAGIFGKPRH